MDLDCCLQGINIDVITGQLHGSYHGTIDTWSTFINGEGNVDNVMHSKICQKVFVIPKLT